MTNVTIEPDRIRFDSGLSISLMRTLRVPVGAKSYPLPPSLGRFPIRRVEEYFDRVPAAWRRQGHAFIPMYQREALWIAFEGPAWRPCAAKVGVGEVNVISGLGWDDALHADPQDYLVVPIQPWLDGVNAGDGLVRQFVATPLGSGRSIEASVTGSEVVGGIQLLVFAPRRGRFPDEPPAPAASEAPFGMGLGAGGEIAQRIVPDPYGVETWDEDAPASVVVHIVNSEHYRDVTGEEPPPTPIDARMYTQHGLPWFEFYDEDRGDVAAPERLRDVAPVSDVEADLDVPADQVKELPRQEGRAR